MNEGLSDKYDGVLLGILQNEGQISNFLDALMGFLYRRTDFYLILKDKTGNAGFPPGVALKLLVNAYKKYEALAAKAELQRTQLLQENRKSVKDKQKLTVKEIRNDEDTPPPAVKEVEITDCRPEQMEVTTEKNEVRDAATDKKCDVNDSELESNLSSSTDVKTDTLPRSNTDENAEKEDESKKDEQKTYQENPESYNGAIRDRYTWSQSITDLDVIVKVPCHIKKGKDVQVTIEKKHLKVYHKDTSQEWQELINEDLTWEINKEESMWSLVPADHIHINMEKRQERWWEALLVDETKICLKNIDASRPMTDLDNEAQCKIEEMMYNQQQKRLGKPQSHEKKTHELLQKAWNAEGSPFKGQEFDPSKFHIDPNSGVVTTNP